MAHASPTPAGKPHRGIAFARLWAMAVKEFVQMRRDRVTFGIMIGIPMIQLILFGFAINSDPKHLPWAKACVHSTDLLEQSLQLGGHTDVTSYACGTGR